MSTITIQDTPGPRNEGLPLTPGTGIIDISVVDSQLQTIFTQVTDVSSGLSSKEPALGNPNVSGYVLSSTTEGTRSWIPSGLNSATGAAPLTLTLNTGALTGSISAATTIAPGTMSAADKTKLDGLSGSAGFFADLDAGSVKYTSTTGPINYNGINTSWDYLPFIDSAAQVAQWVIDAAQVAGHVAGKTWTVKVYWTATAVVGGVTWELSLVGRQAEEPLDVAYVAGHTYEHVAVSTSSEYLNVSTFAGFVPTTNEIDSGDIVFAQLKRLYNDGNDTMVGDAKVVCVSITEA